MDKNMSKGKKNKGYMFLGVSFAFIFLTVVPYLFMPNIVNINVELSFDENNAFKHIENQLSFGPRIPGTTLSENCSDYIINEFSEIGTNFSNIIQNFSINSVKCRNLLFKMNRDKGKIVILGSHYDSRNKSTRDIGSEDIPVPGANDGASGTAVLIELARALYSNKSELGCQIWFAFFDAEDQGHDGYGQGMQAFEWCEGSTQFVKELDGFYNKTKESIDCMINIDLAGCKNIRYIYDTYSTSSLLDELFGIGTALGYKREFQVFPKTAQIIDDHLAFLGKNISVALLIDDFENDPTFHTTKDDINVISNYSLKISGETIEQFIYNNYFLSKNQNYEGNYPWKIDFDGPPIHQVIFIVFTLIAIIGLTGFIFLIKKGERRKKIENKSITFKNINENKE